MSEDKKKEILYEVCDSEHSSCNDDCPVYRLNGHKAPDNEDSGYGCDCFKNGGAMLRFIKEKANGEKVEVEVYEVVRYQIV